MHSPPSVRYPVGRSRAVDRLLMAVWASGAGCAGTAAVGLAMQSGVASWRSWVPCAAVLLSGLSAWHFRRRAVEGWLVFDDGCWSLMTSAAGAGPVAMVQRARMCLDLQRLVLLRVEFSGAPGAWLWVDRDADPSSWRDLRRALCATTGGPHVDSALRQGAGVAVA